MSLDPVITSAIAKSCKEAESVLFITGAGISAESNLPTYRGVGGLYDTGETEEGLPIEELLSGEMMAEDPAVCWKYIHQIEKACRGAKPNLAHEIVAKFDGLVKRTWVVTQNVDGFHTRAGSTNVIEMHGNISRLKCTACSYQSRVDNYEGLGSVPICPKCGAVVRPDVVLFGEMLSDWAINTLRNELERGFDVVFSIGTTSAFPYISAPVVLAARRGATTVEINPQSTPISGLVSHCLRAKAGESLSAIWHALQLACATP
ncbi:MAG: NAD-dependent deacylase [Polyangiaceae bacterium]|nr:NAD-dependent deacylase [Polyangiaceae bacterium]